MGVQLKKAGRVAGLATVLTVAGTSAALAQDLSPVTNFFTTLGEALTGTLGRAIGLVARCRFTRVVVRPRPRVLRRLLPSRNFARPIARSYARSGLT